MKKMKIRIIPCLKQMRSMIQMSRNDAREYFRSQVSEPFYLMWKAINVPLRASKPGGYDVVKAAEMMGFYLGGDGADRAQEALDQLQGINAEELCRQTLEQCSLRFQHMKVHDQALFPDQLVFALYLGDFANRELMELSGGYGGFGGIPGYILVLIAPTAQNLPRLTSAVAHEFHHNIRLSLFPWSARITLGEYLVLEGLADTFAASLYGPDHLGPWVTGLDAEDREYSRQVIGGVLNEQGFDTIRSYLYGDPLADQWGFPKNGLSFCAGYAVGYDLVQRYLNVTGQSIVEATQVPGKKIIEESGYFG